jgi:phenylalanyl-tRNA synthetase beta subunit
MKYSYRLISEYLSEKILPGEMIEYLDLLGLNPLVVSETQDDVIFELETPANRGYLLSLVGVARELIPFTRCSLKLPEDSFPQDNDNGMDVRIEDGDDCSYYSCRIIRNIRNIASP